MISVIIPAYNCENTIEKCINLIKKNKSNIEIIVIEDASTDNTSIILEQIPGIKLIKNKVNKGAGASRNIGIENCKGDYICFVDSDDEVSEGYIDELKKDIGDNDIAICDLITKGNSVKKYSFNFINKEDIIKNPMVASPCGKLFRRNIFNDSRFPEGIINEDLALIVPIIINTDKIIYSKNAKYYYVENINSVQNQKFSEKKFDIFKAFDMCINNINSEKYIEYLVVTQLMFFLIYMLANESSFIKRYKYLKIYQQNISKRKINLTKNKYFFEHIQEKGKLHIYYYLIMFNLLNIHCVFLANLEIAIFNFLKRYKNKKSVIKSDISADDLIELAKRQNKLRSSKIKISVIIPNYNYKQFLYERLFSVLNQNVKLHEVIILDDCSIDDSKKTIEDISNNISEYISIKCIYNTINSGCAFQQWKKGVECATGDYIWIAEADDYCSDEFLSSLLNIIINNDNIRIAYSNTNYINSNGRIIFDKVHELVDTKKTGHWNNSYVIDCIEEYNEYTYLNCTIANVSSVVFKNDDYSSILEDSVKYNQVGDWIFYIGLLNKGGKIAYCNKVYNFYRIHGENQTTQTRLDNHLKQILQVYKWQEQKYGLSSVQHSEIKNRVKYLKNEWRIQN